jgi:hypothetical protein
MPGEEQEIREAIEMMFRAKIPLVASWFTVKSIEDTTCTIVIDEENDLELEGILLAFNKSDVAVKPKIKTDVLVVFTDGSRTNGIVIKCQETESIAIMGDEFGGLIKVEELVKRMNLIEDRINKMISTFDSHTHVSPPAPVNPVTTATPLPVMATPISQTQKTQIENPKIKHGKG